MLNVECSQSGSVLIIVLWVAIGLVSIALYFANSMTYELRASDNRAQRPRGGPGHRRRGALRQLLSWQFTRPTARCRPPTEFACAAVPVGDAQFWLIGRDPSGTPSTEPYFGLVDEGSKLNLNTVNTNVLSYLPNMTTGFCPGHCGLAQHQRRRYSLDYSHAGLLPENTRRLKPWTNCGWSMARPWICSPATTSTATACSTRTKRIRPARRELNSGLFEYTTVYTREPNFHSDGIVADQREHGAPAAICKRFLKTPASATRAIWPRS